MFESMKATKATETLWTSGQKVPGVLFDSSILLKIFPGRRHLQNWMSPRSGLRDQAMLGRMLFETQKRLQHLQAQPSGNYDPNSDRLKPLVNHGGSTWVFPKNQGTKALVSIEWPLLKHPYHRTYRTSMDWKFFHAARVVISPTWPENPTLWEVNLEQVHWCLQCLICFSALHFSAFLNLRKFTAYFIRVSGGCGTSSFERIICCSSQMFWSYPQNVRWMLAVL